jgi:hypothetical protein
LCTLAGRARPRQRDARAAPPSGDSDDSPAGESDRGGGSGGSARRRVTHPLSFGIRVRVRTWECGKAGEERGKIGGHMGVENTRVR